MHGFVRAFVAKITWQLFNIYIQGISLGGSYIFFPRPLIGK
jgi:hypothetical protein